MAKTINWANVSIGFDATKIKAGVDMSRQDLGNLTRILRQSQDPMAKLEYETKLLGDAFQKGAIDAATYARALDKVKREADSAGGKQNLLVSGLAKVGALGLGIGAIAKTKDLLSTSLSTIDEQANVARTIGEDINKLRKFAFEQSMLGGVEFGDAIEALRQLQNMVGLAAVGMGKGEKLLDQLGLDAQTLAKDGPVEQFKQITNALRGIEDQATRAAIADKLFGNSKLVQAALATQQEIEQVANDAERFVATLSEADVASIEKLNDQLDITGRRLQSISDRVMGVSAPATLSSLTNVLNGMELASEYAKVLFGGEGGRGERQAAVFNKLLDQVQREVELHKTSEAIKTEATKARSALIEEQTFLQDMAAEAHLADLDREAKHAQEMIAFEKEMERIQQQRMEAGKRLTEKYDPIAKARREIAEIQALLNSGAISQDIFDRERKGILGDAAKAQGMVGDSTAPLLIAGTKEAFSGVAKQMDERQKEILDNAVEQKLNSKILVQDQKEALTFLKKISENAIKAFR